MWHLVFSPQCYKIQFVYIFSPLIQFIIFFDAFNDALILITWERIAFKTPIPKKRIPKHAAHKLHVTCQRHLCLYPNKRNIKIHYIFKHNCWLFYHSNIDSMDLLIFGGIVLDTHISSIWQYKSQINLWVKIGDMLQTASEVAVLHIKRLNC